MSMTRNIDTYRDTRRRTRRDGAEAIGRGLPDPLPRETAETHFATRLRSLAFADFARCVAELLTALGYEDVQLAGRTGYKGRNKDGGYDLAATSRAGLSRRRVVVQLKQFGVGERVYQRSVDELRGVALRAGADEAILVTTGIFSSILQNNDAAILNRAYAVAELTGPTVASVLPVHLLDGAALCTLLLQRGIRVPEKADTAAAYIDKGVGRAASAAAAVLPPAARSGIDAGSAPTPGSSQASVTLIVRINPGNDNAAMTGRTGLTSDR